MSSIINPSILWLTGLSGSGKTTLALKLKERFLSQGVLAVILDGDVVRTGLCKDLGFSDQDRSENVRRLGEVAKLFLSNDIIPICALISPLEKQRAIVRTIANDVSFFEIYVKCSIEGCIKRDPKGLYKRAMTGEIKEFTGISSIYEIPEKPDIIIDTELFGIDQCVNLILEKLRR